MSTEREAIEKQLYEELGFTWKRQNSALTVTIFEPFKVESLVPIDKTYRAHFLMDDAWAALVAARLKLAEREEFDRTRRHHCGAPLNAAGDCERCHDVAAMCDKLKTLREELASATALLTSAEFRLAGVERERDEERAAHEEIADVLLPLVGTADGTSVSAAKRASLKLAAADRLADKVRAKIDNCPACRGTGQTELTRYDSASNAMEWAGFEDCRKCSALRSALLEYSRTKV